jgi:phosphate transport system substrate-binding protein
MFKTLFKPFTIIALTSILTSCIYDKREQVAKKEKDKTSSTIIIKGSTTIHPLMEKLTDNFLLSHKDLKIQISSSGSMEGIKSLLRDSADIAMSSHEISPEVKAGFIQLKKHYVEYLVAGDALVFAVNTKNPVRKLSSKQITDIFSGKITNWKDVGGKDAKIKVISRDYRSGTYAFFKEEVMQNAKLSKSTALKVTNEDVLSTISKDINAIGYTNFSMLNYSVEPLSIAFESDTAHYIAPRLESVSNMTYKYSRGLFLYYNPDKYQKIKSLMEMLHADSTKLLIEKACYIPVNQKLITD